MRTMLWDKNLPISIRIWVWVLRTFPGVLFELFELDLIGFDRYDWALSSSASYGSSKPELTVISVYSNTDIFQHLQSILVRIERENAGFRRRGIKKESSCSQLSIFVPLKPTAECFLMLRSWSKFLFWDLFPNCIGGGPGYFLHQNHRRNALRPLKLFIIFYLLVYFSILLSIKQ